MTIVQTWGIKAHRTVSAFEAGGTFSSQGDSATREVWRRDRAGQFPDQAGSSLGSQIAARLLAAFLKTRRPIKEALLGDDLAAARRLVNGGAHGLERFREAYTIRLPSIS